jgi:hypothetical protein
MAGIAAESELTAGASSSSPSTPPPSAPLRRQRADGVRYELATPADDGEIRRLLRENPMPGRIAISLEREPDASLAAAVEGDLHHTIVARDTSSGRLIAMGSVSVRDRYIDGQPTRVGYLGQLRLDRSVRPRASIVVGGYRLFRELHASLGVTLYLTSIASDNVPARRLLERGLPGMPTYRPRDTFVTSLFPPQGWPRPRGDVKVNEAGIDRVGDMLACLERNGRRFQFAPVWREADLAGRIESGEIQPIVATRGGRVVGCLAEWDQSAYKQAVVRGYAPRLARWRRIVNVAGSLLGVPHLPPIGTPLNLAQLSHIAVDDDDPAVFAALLRYACLPSDRALGYETTTYNVLGLSERHPLSAAIPHRMRRHAYRTNLYAVYWPDDPAGRAAADALDRRPANPEVALL